MKYDYRVFLPWAEYAEIMYSDLKGFENVKLIYNPFKGGASNYILGKLYYIHFLSRFSKYLPLKSIWNRYLYSEEPSDSNKLCFIFFISDLKKSKRCFFIYLKRKYPNSKFVMYFEDTVQSRFKNGKNSLDFETLRVFFDITLSYDIEDCKKYGYTYYPTPYSRLKRFSDASLPESDLFFCGLAKKRLGIIEEVFKVCTDDNVKCDFIICSTSKSDQTLKGIVYRNKTISYSDYLRHLSKTRCILEINQEGAVGYSLRVWEALVYGKKLITNNKQIQKEPFYSQEQFYIIDTPSNINIDFIKKEDIIEPKFVEELSPKRMIAFIDTELIKKFQR